MSTLPHFLGLGVARAGSTWLARNLSLHPEVFLPDKKELHFFDREYDKGTAYYESQFQGRLQEKVAGEITPQYFHNEACLGRIKSCLPDARFIVCLRDPVERAYSHYWKTVASAKSTVKSSFEDRLLSSTEILSVGMYHEHLSRYFREYDRDRFHIFLFEDIKSRPAELIKEIYQFLEVDDNFVSPMTDARVNAAASQGQLGRSRIAWHTTRVLKKLGVHGLEKRLEKANHSQLPKMNEETSRQLQLKYTEPNRKLEELLNLDLSAWG